MKYKIGQVLYRMNKKKQLAMTVAFLFLVELIYFITVILLMSLTGIVVSSFIIQIVGFILGVLYTTVFDSWLRLRMNRLNYEIQKVALEQRQLKRRVFKLEKEVMKYDNKQ